MTRWNVATIFFLGVNGQRRDVCLTPGEMNIITGASGTGKSTLIKAIDYCLGSRTCELPAHVRRRSVAVGVKWVAGTDEMILGRIVPPVGQAKSTHMYVASGRDLALPQSLSEFEGGTTVEAAKAFIERAFGIGDLPRESDHGDNPHGRATVRLVTPYIFVTKEVIYSESVLLHGLERADKARDIVAAIPYFLRAIDEASAIDERRLRNLRRTLDKEEERERARASADSAARRRTLGLLVEAYRVGLASEPEEAATEDDLISRLRSISDTRLPTSAYPNDGELGSLHSRRQAVLERLSDVRRQLQATRSTIREANGFETAVNRQREKLKLAEHLLREDVIAVCPTCEAPSDRGQRAAQTLRSVVEKVRGESAAIERVKPQLVNYDRALEGTVANLNSELRFIDEQIRSWIRQSEETRQLANLDQLRAHLLGRISFFLESYDEPRRPPYDLSVLRDEIAELESRVDREAKEVKLRHAESKISTFASEAFAALPTVAPCVGSELSFSSRKPEVTVIEAGRGSVLRLPDVGSDQNYLAIHIALSFALQRYFETVNAPVPGLLVLDQVSRPYFPSRPDDSDEHEINGGDEDEDVLAMRKHIDFLFAETARRSGLQVLLIEHAYFADDRRFVAATRERWNRSSGNALIPLSWPTRADG